MIALIDTGTGNLGSIEQAFLRIGASLIRVAEGSLLEKTSAIVLPGVCSFMEGMSSLKEKQLYAPIRTAVLEQKKPIIGLCLGMQLLASFGEEGGAKQEGLGLIKGSVKKLNQSNSNYRVPNIGWCDVTPAKSSVLFPAEEIIESFYHVHSYHLVCDSESDVAATIEFSAAPVTVAVAKDNIFGVQFHPEKSQDAGLDLLKRFVDHIL